MSDPFLDDKNCVDRLFAEWKKYGSLIIAFDFDCTVFDYHNKGDTYEKVIELLRECRRQGFHLTVFTSCNDDRFDFIKDYLTKNDIPFDGINETPDFIPFKGRKVYFNVLLDDRAGLRSAYEQLWTTIYTIRGYKANINLQDAA
jgi:hypothetical protein